MKVAVLTPYTSPIVGGITTYTTELMAGYGHLGMTCLGLACVGRENSDFKVLGPSKIQFTLLSVLDLLRFKPDVIHSHSHWYALLPGVVAKFMRPKTRLLFTFHTYAGNGRERLGIIVLRSLLSRCDGVSFVSQEMMSSVGLPGSIRQAVVYPAPERSTLSHASKIAVRQPVIIAVAPFVWSQKVRGILLLLDAFSAIARSFPDWNLVIIGDGPLRGETEERAAELDLRSRILFLGTRSDTVDQISRASVFAQISFQEGLPVSLLNAMAVGTSVIATSVGGIPELVHHLETGYLVDASPLAVADGLRKLLEDASLRLALGTNARGFVLGKFTWDDVARRNLGLIDGRRA